MHAKVLLIKLRISNSRGTDARAQSKEGALEMVPLLRLAFWIAAIVFAAAPVALGIVAGPEHFWKLFQGRSYIPFGRDLFFLSIAILAIGLIDSLEAVLALRNQHAVWMRTVFAFTFLLLILIVIQLCFYAYWSSHVEPQPTPEAIAASLYLVLFAGMSAFFARLILISSPVG
jgi:O-antigen/teichoic acid export membrane protein